MKRGWVRTAISRDLAEARARDRRARRARAAAAEYAGFDVAVAAVAVGELAGFMVETLGGAGSLFAAADCPLADDSGASASTTAHATHPRRNRDMSGIGTLSTRLT